MGSGFATTLAMTISLLEAKLFRRLVFVSAYIWESFLGMRILLYLLCLGAASCLWQFWDGDVQMQLWTCD